MLPISICGIVGGREREGVRTWSEGRSEGWREGGRERKRE